MGFRNEFGYGQGLILVLVATASMLTVTSMAKTIVVGGSQGWKFGFNYSAWAEQLPPIHARDTFVFKYDPPNSTTFPHNVYLLPDSLSYDACNLTTAKLVANVTEGGGEGFKFVVGCHPYFFACGVGNGTHCNAGLMKFKIHPRD